MDNSWYILGAGALGSLYAAFLASAGADVTIVERSTNRQGKPNGGRLAPERKFSVASSVDAINRAFSINTSQADNHSEIKHLLVATKSYDAVAAVSSVRHRLTRTSDVVLMSNGSGYQHQIAKAVSEPRYFYCLSTEGANWRSANALIHAGSGKSRLGGVDHTHPAEWFPFWERAIPGASWEDDIESALWMKLVINAAINPISALGGVQNGELTSDPALSTKVANLCAELSALTGASAYPQLAGDLESEVRKVIAGTASNRSSMLQDIEAGRPTEIDFINGYVSAEARRLEIPTPLNDALVGAIVELESTTNGKREIEANPK
ncbi:2-dehydropantoate 2-reductase [Marinobacter alexandrii]|uniref:2-dehydropantoate 2-reductase n=1 Tax=Marinobacter alexandrii TaxID=2570351 RepID=UPI0032982DB0